MEKNYNNNNNISQIMTVYKKLSHFIGNIVILSFIMKLIDYLLKSYNINLMDPFYIKILCIISIFVSFLFCLDCLLEFLMYIYFKNNKNLNISDKLPKIVYNYINNIKVISEIEGNFNRFFLINIVIYLIVLLVFTIMLLII